ncbi:Na(+)/H(+) antiporter subunit E [Methanimicrococcus sp. At1]|uniref:Na(+)/H(+) antiporter subunit E n=1 Tax=Methanimicrococcus hacksteinii TaxID=3028293 RepID=A0ABU3VQS5_9EURY|nr:Na+/H+ antiporter subunit E [Methanimicrococcus sp. At1]MDV0445769.1 Na(+)/H(+) antiporter subunit E [Methanimicrococcus sp. At1]
MIRIMKYTIYVMLGFVWVLLSGTLSIGNYLLGVFFSMLILYPFRDMFTFTDSAKDVVRKIPKKIKYFGVLFFEIGKANLFMMYKILQPKLDIRPGIIAYPFTTTRSVSTTMLANTISLTPGTLIMDVHVKNKSLKGPGIFYVHSIYIESPKEVRDSIREDLEEVVLEAFE